MDNTELAYLAGIFDGEGCLGIVKTRGIYQRQTAPRYRIRLHITNTSKNLMDWVESLGWYVRERKEPSMKKEWKRCWVAVVNDNVALGWMQKMLPYLKVKRDEVLLGIKFQEHKNCHANNHQIGIRGSVPMSEEEIQFREDLKRQLSELKQQKI